MPSSLLQRLQRGVALETLCESGSSFRAESIFRETASVGAEAGAEGCQWALTKVSTLGRGGALERGHGTPLEPLAQLRDALRGVCALEHYSSVGSMVRFEAAELVVGQTAMGWARR